MIRLPYKRGFILDTDYNFDCSLFQDDFPELAAQVIKVCQVVGFAGLEKIRIPYAQAKAFAEERGALFNGLMMLDENIDFSNNTEYKATHAQLIMDYLTESSGFMSFFNKMRHINMMFKLNNPWINRVAYGLFDN